MLKIWIFYILLLLFSSYAYSNSLTNIKCSMAFLNPIAVHNAIHKQNTLDYPIHSQRMKELNNNFSTEEAIENKILQERTYTYPSHANIHKINQLDRHLDQIHKNKQHLK